MLHKFLIGSLYIKLSSIHQAKTLIISGIHSAAVLEGGSVKSAVNIARLFSNKKDEEKDFLPVHLRLPPGKPIEVPGYLKKGHPYEISIRSGPIRNDDPRTEEEREKEFWDRVERELIKLSGEQKSKKTVGYVPFWA